MKLFKHRGDIYVSKAGYKNSREERILLSLLVVIVILTISFLILLGTRYDSFGDFIAGDDVTVEVTDVQEDLSLPEINGRTNFVIMETDDEESVLHYMYLVQMDCDNMAYKVCTLSPNMVIDGDSVLDLYLTGGGALVQSKLVSHLGIDIDYYIDFERSDFVEFLNSFGTFIVPIKDDIMFNSGYDDDSYSIRVGDGEQTISGSDAPNLVRYYINEKNDYSSANEVVLYGLTQLFNADNFEKCDQFFRKMITNSSSNITVRDFENNKASVMVFCHKNSDIIVYSCTPKYSEKKLTDKSIQNIKGYFN